VSSRALATRQARANEEREARTNKKERERGSTTGWCSGPVALGVGLTAASNDDDGGATLDEEDGAARRRLGQDGRWRGEEERRALAFIGQGTFSSGPSHSPGLKVFHQIMAPVQAP